MKTFEELQSIVLNLVNNGYSTHENVRHCDDMHDCTEEEIDRAHGYLDELLAIGTTEFSKKYNLK